MISGNKNMGKIKVGLDLTKNQTPEEFLEEVLKCDRTPIQKKSIYCIIRSYDIRA